MSVALSRTQFEALQAPVANERKLWKIIQAMERLSRRIIFAAVPDTQWRKRLRPTQLPESSADETK